MPQREVTSCSPTIIGAVITKSAMSGAMIGAVQAFVGYFPRPNVVFAIVAATIVGAVFAIVFGSTIYLVAFRRHNVLAALSATAWMSGVCGAIAAAFFRWWTHGTGGVLSANITVIAAAVTATAIRMYISFERAKSNG
jgi:hypothetical protein